ncbi:homocysteine S-methyltransferase family protein [Thalassospira sp. HF15]|uniref:homocysteine S-methyltransferase family protein n=1 Tax=Thalassospira sp. HF15 TaxID=2722755 RepID=UPI00143125C2|nr:homocysteine S-methyltransferase family protein [Thalassospira sp. HF15]NIY76083.1 homocysteine S-methyltransferase family protein [Thalassospira sp. HF15]
MSTRTSHLPPHGQTKFITDGGLETTLIFHDGIDLPHFASFDLLKTDEGCAHITAYYERYLELAKKAQAGFILESPTWRANRDWAEKIGYDEAELAELNRKAIDLMADLRDRYHSETTPCLISGNIGPRGDGYVPSLCMTVNQARAYHVPQIVTFAKAGVDMVSVVTINYPNEAVGIALACRDVDMPCVISFTVETDGHLPSGEPLRDAIAMVDDMTAGYPAYYMINCAHPDHFRDKLEDDGAWKNRICGIRANASRQSHAELDASEHLDDGNPDELGRLYRDLADLLPNLSVLGGCCGTDHRHVNAMAEHALAHLRTA